MLGLTGGCGGGGNQEGYFDVNSRKLAKFRLAENWCLSHYFSTFSCSGQAFVVKLRALRKQNPGGKGSLDLVHSNIHICTQMVMVPIGLS